MSDAINNTRIAVVSDDGKTVSKHFGWAPYYVVFTLADRQVVGREVREKANHGSASAGHEHHHGHGAEGHDHHAHQSQHGPMFQAIGDCSVVLSGGMGAGAYNGLHAFGVEPAFVTSTTVEEAVSDYLDGRTVDYSLCQH